MNTWSEIRNDFIDDQGIAHIDAWLTPDDNENGEVIARVDTESGEILYLDDRARTDELAQEKIKEILEDHDLSY